MRIARSQVRILQCPPFNYPTSFRFPIPLNYLDKHQNQVHDFPMKKRRPLRLPLGFCGGWLARIIFVFATSLTLNEALGAPSMTSPFTTYRYPQDDLGATYNPQAATMKLWAPTAGKVDLALFDDAATAASSLTFVRRAIPTASGRSPSVGIPVPGCLAGIERRPDKRCPCE